MSESSQLIVAVVVSLVTGFLLLAFARIQGLRWTWWFAVVAGVIAIGVIIEFYDSIDLTRALIILGVYIGSFFIFAFAEDRAGATRVVLPVLLVSFLVVLAFKYWDVTNDPESAPRERNQPPPGEIGCLPRDCMVGRYSGFARDPHGELSYINISIIMIDGWRDCEMEVTVRAAAGLWSSVSECLVDWGAASVPVLGRVTIRPDSLCKVDVSDCVCIHPMISGYEPICKVE